MKRYKIREEDIKYFNSINKSTYKCKNCGRSVIISARNKTICPTCGYYVFINEKEEFKQRIMEKLGKKNE